MAQRPAPRLVPLVEGIHRRLKGSLPGEAPEVAFYPYVDTKCTIRVRDGRLLLRLSDHMDGAPDDAVAGVVGILLCRLWGWPESRWDVDARDAYARWLEEERAGSRRSRSRRERGRKHIEPVGVHRSLLESYLRVTMGMDLLVPRAPRLSWSQQDSRRRFGHWDADHNAIVISQALDDPKVPEWVLDYVVYHEVLHIVHPPRQGTGGRRLVHPPEFVQAERRFPRWEEADAWLGRLAAKRRRKRRVA